MYSIGDQLLHSDSRTAEREALGLNSQIYGAAGIPAPIFQAFVPRRSGVFDVKTHTFGTVDEPVTFTRATAGWSRVAGNTFAQFAAGEPRTWAGLGNWLGYLIEPAATNELIGSSEFDGASWSNSGGVTVASSSEICPDGSTDAQLITDPGGSGSGMSNVARVFQTVVPPNDTSTWSYSIFIRKAASDPGTYPLLNIGFFGVGTPKHGMTAFNPFTGETDYLTDTGVGGEGPADSVNVEDWGDWWRVTQELANNATGNTDALFRVCPAATDGLTTGFDPSHTGSVTIWQADLKNEPVCSSPIPTTTGAVIRNADVISWANSPAGYTAAAGMLALDLYLPRDAAVYPDADNDLITIRAANDTILRVNANDGGSCTFTSEATPDATQSVASAVAGRYRALVLWETGGDCRVGVDSGAGLSFGTARSFSAWTDENVLNVVRSPQWPTLISNLRIWNRNLGAAEAARILSL